MQRPKYSKPEYSEEAEKNLMLSAIKRDVKPEISRALQEMIREEDTAYALYTLKADKLEHDAALLHRIPEFVKWCEASAQKFREMAAQERSHRDRLQDMLDSLQQVE